MSRKLYGIVAEFATAEALIDAARHARKWGFQHVEAYTPFPVDELTAILHRPNWLPLVVLLGGITGGLTGYLLQVYIAVYDYPINVGGRPLHSWPSFIIVTFELTILFASLAAFFGTLFFGGMPAPYHPAANAPGFDTASSDRFFLCIEAADPIFDRDGTVDFLSTLKPERIEEVEA